MRVPADAEQAVIDELSGWKPTATTVQPAQAEFLRVTQGGGFQVNEVADEFLVTLESFAATEAAASANLSGAVGRLTQKAELSGALGSETCYGVRGATTPQNYPMPSVPTHRRYLVTLAVRLRRREV